LQIILRQGHTTLELSNGSGTECIAERRTVDAELGDALRKGREGGREGEGVNEDDGSRMAVGRKALRSEGRLMPSLAMPQRREGREGGREGGVNEHDIFWQVKLA